MNDDITICCECQKNKRAICVGCSIERTDEEIGLLFEEIEKNHSCHPASGIKIMVLNDEWQSLKRKWLK